MSILKELKNSLGEHVWSAYYNSEGSLQFENEKIDINGLRMIFGDIDVVNICSDDYYKKYFKPVENFDYLLDCSPIKKGKTVFLIGDNIKGEFTVKDFKEIDRASGIYDKYVWTEIDNMLYYSIGKVYYENHKVYEFTVKENDNTYIWEDYNYHQSNIKRYLDVQRYSK